MKNWNRARRALLKTLGLGAAGLPLLHASRALGQSTRVPRNLVCVHIIHGYRMAGWKPAAGSLLGQTLPRITAPLEPHKADLLFATELSHAGGGSGDYGYGTVFWGKPGVGAIFRQPDGPTLDQVVAQAAQPPFARRSLALGVQLDLMPHATNAPGGNFAFWSGAGQPVAPALDPAVTYRMIFGDAGADLTAVNRLRFQRKSILDYVGGSLQRFSGRVGTMDRELINAHLERIRELERSLERVSGSVCGAMAPPALDLADPAEYANILDAQMKLMVAALACGVTRVVTLQLADATGTSLRFGAYVPGVPLMSKFGYKTPYRNWADLGNNPVMDGVDHKSLVDAWWMGRLSELLTRMKAIPHPAGGTLFDQTIVLWANVVEEGASKDGNRKPWIVANGTGGPLRTGQHLATGGLPSSGVLAAVCQAMKVPHTFGDPLPGLLV